MTEKTRVLITDDHPMVREGLRAMLTIADDLELVAEAATGQEAIDEALEKQPDVAIIDLQLPDLSGIQVTREITRQSPHVAVLVLTMADDDESVFAAMRAGARGYFLKGATRDDLTRGIHAVAAGEAIFSPAVATRVIAYFTHTQPQQCAAFPQLTNRELDVLQLLAAGDANAVIARKLVLSDKTIRNNISNIFTKLQVADRAQAIVRAREAGLGTIPDGEAR
jgi:DNA-binding NarL/FixJ family response regulator